jgi:hypothetical protein
MSLGLTLISGVPLEMSFGTTFRPIGVFLVSTRWPRNLTSRKRNLDAAPP